MIRTLILCVVSGLAAPAAAQPAVEPADACALAPTLSVTARVRADKLRIVQAGEAEARIWSEPGGEGEWKLDRKGLPDPIPAGRTFANVELNLNAEATVREDGAVAVDASADTGAAHPGLTEPICD